MERNRLTNCEPVLKHGPNTACGGNARKESVRLSERSQQC
jgi:hypothetical protein